MILYLAVLHVESVTDVVDLLVDLGTVMVSLLTGTSDGELDTARMPSADTSDLAETLVRLSWQLLGVPTGSHTCKNRKLKALFQRKNCLAEVQNLQTAKGFDFIEILKYGNRKVFSSEN